MPERERDAPAGAGPRQTPAGRICQLTPPGRGAVATVRWEGDLAVWENPTPLAVTSVVSGIDRLPLNRVCLARWGGAEAPEEVVLCRVAERVVEIHCHGGRAAVARIVRDLIARGGVAESPDAWLDRTQPRLEAECRRALLHTTTERTAALVAAQKSGLLRRELESIRSCSVSAGARARLDRLLSWERFGRHLTQPWSVVLCGRPNVGKSSLLNALVGYGRAIVSPQPGTTRDVVTADVVLEGWPILLADTAGLREPQEAIESAGIQRGQTWRQTADLMLLIVDVGEPPTPEDETLLAAAAGGLVVAHKCDLPNRWSQGGPPGALAVSSRTGEGLSALARAIVERLVPVVPPNDAAIPVSPLLAEELRQIRALIDGGDRAELDRAWGRLLDPPPAGD
jgi:tRNA modification GTPase